MKTKVMKSSLKFLAIIAFIGITLQSCSNDDDPMDFGVPVISSFEYGEGHHGEDEDHDHDEDEDHEGEEAYAFRGTDMHVEAEILAEATVASITLSIHSHDLDLGDNEVEWSFEKVYTDSNYLVMNPEFHEHIDIPATAPVGEYHVEFVVTDENGNSTEVEGHVQVLDINISDVSIDEAVARGDDFHAEFFIDTVNGIHSVSIDVHAHGVTVGEGEVEWDYEETFTEGLHGLTEAEFHKHIDVPANAPAGEYHMTFTVEDEDGNTKEYETHIDVTA